DSTARASKDDTSSRSTACERAAAVAPSSVCISACSSRTSAKIWKIISAAIGKVASRITAIRCVRSDAVGHEGSFSCCSRRIVEVEQGRQRLPQQLKKWCFCYQE